MTDQSNGNQKSAQQAKVSGSGFVAGWMSFWGAVFDLKFRRFATLKIASTLYVLCMGGAGLMGWDIMKTEGFIQGILATFGLLILSRMVIEFVVVQFRTAENTSRMFEFMSEGKTADEEINSMQD